MGIWKYEVWACRIDATKPEDHDGSCGSWQRVAIHWDKEWFEAVEKATHYVHAYVQSMYAKSGGTVNIFEHVEGGGLCWGCWKRHLNTHTEHEIPIGGERCTPCLDVQKRRGPLVRMADGDKFLCDECRNYFRKMHVRTNYALGLDANPRLYRSVLDIMREDSRA